MLNVQIVDLDNCISDDEWRIRKINWDSTGDEKWDEYHELCDQDNPKNLDQIQNELPIVIFTARPMKFSEKTKWWLKQETSILDRVVHMYMRPEGDSRSSIELKRSFLADLADAHGIYPENILAAIDDREDIVSMYNLLGIEARVVKIHNTCAYTKPTSFQQEGNCASSDDGVCVDNNSVLSILESSIETFKQRNSVYGDLFDTSGETICSMFPGGIELKTPEEFARFTQFLFCYSKLARYAVNLKNGGHKDSIHDLIVCAAILERLTQE